MRWLKSFENHSINPPSESDIKEIFIDFIDDFEIKISIVERLFHLEDSTDNESDEIKLVSKPYISITLIPLIRINIRNFVKGEYFKERLEELKYRLNDLELEIHEITYEDNSLIFNIY